MASMMWFEIGFDVAYLVTIWALVIVMARRLPRIRREADRPVARLFLLAFGLLALGDTGHVGFRVWAYALGDLEATVAVGPWQLGIVGLGSLATAITLTVFYGVMVWLWRVRAGRALDGLVWFLLAMAPLRLLLLLPAGNQWHSAVPPQPWATMRNLPLIVAGLGVAWLMVRDGRRLSDPLLRLTGGWIFVSYAFYLPVILFVQQVPLLGMLMVPKTLAYVAIAIVAVRNVFRVGRPVASRPLAPTTDSA